MVWRISPTSATSRPDRSADPMIRPPDFAYLRQRKIYDRQRHFEQSLFTRPVQSEAVDREGDAKSSSGDNTTTRYRRSRCAYLYDRTTTTVYGNVVEVTQGSTVAGEVLGSGDGRNRSSSSCSLRAPDLALESDGTIPPQPARW